MSIQTNFEAEGAKWKHLFVQPCAVSVRGVRISRFMRRRVTMKRREVGSRLPRT